MKLTDAEKDYLRALLSADPIMRRHLADAGASRFGPDRVLFMFAVLDRWRRLLLAKADRMERDATR